jgi:Uma2 family endonuclease
MLQPELLPHYTLADYRRWEGEWELILGIPYAMTPSPTIGHQRVRMAIARQLYELLTVCPNCLVLDETDWIVSEDTVVRPDVMVVCGQILGDYPTKTPKLIFEVVSPSTASKDERLKFDLYQQEGVKSYVLVYPERKVAKIFGLSQGRLVKQGDATSEKHSFDLEYCQIEFDFALIWP